MASRSLLLHTVALAVAGSLACATAALAAWKTEPGVAAPSYAVAQPDRQDLNVDSIVQCMKGGPMALRHVMN